MRGGKGNGQRRPAFSGSLTKNAAKSSNGDSPAANSSSATDQPKLSAQAQEFVPGQPSESSQKSTQSSKQAKSVPVRPKKQQRPKVIKPPKYGGTERGTTIQEDIVAGRLSCSICTENVTRRNPVFSCPKCYNVLHWKCVKEWVQYQDDAEKKFQKGIEPWRGPCCNSEILGFPKGPTCWCAKEPFKGPSPATLPPHSCGEMCQKELPNCDHRCIEQCHAGACPPCPIVNEISLCHCGAHEERKSCRQTDRNGKWSCGEPCGTLLQCGTHSCEKPCHQGPCEPCRLEFDSICFCGEFNKRLRCDEREEIRECHNSELGDTWEGSYSCGNKCDRLLDCGVHRCLQTCHVHDEKSAAGHCPWSPELVVSCACGRTSLEALEAPVRQSCQDPLATCEETCGKALVCGHRCQSKCHEGECPVCPQPVQLRCRCGRVSEEATCYGGHLGQPMCFSMCRDKLNCGRHQCREHCCPVEKSGPRRQQREEPVEHICTRVCDRPLKCGRHSCPELCHRGPCPPCRDGIFEDLTCHCGSTVLRAPLRCGTQPPVCTEPCQREPSCGHPPVPHPCHGDDADCPKCPTPVEKRCACGRQTRSHVPCHIKEVYCGTLCGKELPCGHKCTKACHREGECEGSTRPGNCCNSICGKPRSICGHPDQSLCHGKTPCSESLPCPAKVTITCECGHRKSEVKCLACDSHLDPAHKTIQCDDECARLARNARLADALRINPETELTDHVPYSDDTIIAFQELKNWAEKMEREIRVFAATPGEHRIAFDPMDNRKRQFIHLLCMDHRLTTFSQDAGVHRHVTVEKPLNYPGGLQKTLGQCVKIRAKQAAEKKAEEAAAQALAQAPFNALLLTSVGFGLTVEDIKEGIESLIVAQGFVLQSVKFLPTEEVLLRITASYSASLGPNGLESGLLSLRDAIVPTVQDRNLAGNVVLVAVDWNDHLTRRERVKMDPQGWNAIARKVKEPQTPDEPAAAKGKKVLMAKKKQPETKGSSAWGVLQPDAEA